MLKFLQDIKSTLYSADGYMSLFRFTFAIAFFVLIGIAIADFVCAGLTFDHYSELALFVGSLGGLCCGNKLVDIKGANNDTGQ